MPDAALPTSMLATGTCSGLRTSDDYLWEWRQLQPSPVPRSSGSSGNAARAQRAAVPRAPAMQCAAAPVCQWCWPFYHCTSYLVLS